MPFVAKEQGEDRQLLASVDLLSVSDVQMQTLEITTQFLANNWKSGFEKPLMSQRT
jgi:hypothetical protein